MGGLMMMTVGTKRRLNRVVLARWIFVLNEVALNRKSSLLGVIDEPNGIACMSVLELTRYVRWRVRGPIWLCAPYLPDSDAIFLSQKAVPYKAPHPPEGENGKDEKNPYNEMPGSSLSKLWFCSVLVWLTCMGMGFLVVSLTSAHWQIRSPWPPTCSAACKEQNDRN